MSDWAKMYKAGLLYVIQVQVQNVFHVIWSKISLARLAQMVKLLVPDWGSPGWDTWQPTAYCCGVDPWQVTGKRWALPCGDLRPSPHNKFQFVYTYIHNWPINDYDYYYYDYKVVKNIKHIKEVKNITNIYIIDCFT